MNKNEYILKTVIRECKKHSKRMNYAYKNLSHKFPLTSEKILKQSDEEIALLDQFIYRFSKLQDAIGQKLFKSVLILLDENVENKSAIDIFNRLEQLEVINDYETWKNLRALRNELAHEYEEDEDKLAELLNLLFEKKSQLEKYFIDILSYLSNKSFAV
ncbi:MAG: hypothetical protein KKD86_20010 [Bacteroidetes bacterium]|nr:hypothetical protein [Bacteroidota bacterium]MBU1681111.1 hypothetical protein [Bacteroidota bacterium]